VSEQFEYVVVGLGALGSATAHQLASRGCHVLGLEQFALGHSRGASHDTSRILRHSYHTTEYVRLTMQAYADWSALEQASGQRLVTVVGGLDLFPPDPAIALSDYAASMTEAGIPFLTCTAEDVQARWPQFRLPDGAVALYQERAAIVPAGRGTRVMQDLSRAAGAELRDNCPVTAVRDLGRRGIEVETAGERVRCRRLIVCADAWTNHVLAGLDWRIPLEVRHEQVTYFAPTDPAAYALDRIPLWIWMDDPSFYGFPCYGEPTVKAAQDCGGPPVDPDRADDPIDQEMMARVQARVHALLPGAGEPVRSSRCLYTLTPDRDFVLDAVPGHEGVLVGLGAAHGFKFAPTFGRLLAELAETGGTSTDLTTFALDRPALTDPAYPAHYLV
jgi:sarcosine oxidase